MSETRHRADLPDSLLDDVCCVCPLRGHQYRCHAMKPFALPLLFWTTARLKGCGFRKRAEVLYARRVMELAGPNYEGEDNEDWCRAYLAGKRPQLSGAG